MPALSDLLKQPQQPIVPSEDELVPVDDYPRIRKQVFERALQATQEAFPVQNDRYTIQLKDLSYSGPETFSKADHKKAILEGTTLARKLTARYELIDNSTGQVVTRSGRKTVMNVPYLTDYGTFVRNGVEYGVPKQFRMRPGVYTLQAADGTYQSQFNAKPRTGPSFRMFMDPQSAMFYFKVSGRKVPAYPVLKAMQVPDEQIREAWGADIFKTNSQARTPAHAVSWIEETIRKQHSRSNR